MACTVKTVVSFLKINISLRKAQFTADFQIELIDRC